MAKGWADEKLQIALVSWVFINILTAIDDLILGYVFTNDYTKSFVSVSTFMFLVNVLSSQSLTIVLTTSKVYTFSIKHVAVIYKTLKLLQHLVFVFEIVQFHKQAHESGFMKFVTRKGASGTVRMVKRYVRCSYYNTYFNRTERFLQPLYYKATWSR